jgi:ABC-type bacteriocin/lantibiotic exporter with double-glycine peptidase domain
VGTLPLFIRFLRIHNVPGDRCIDEGKIVQKGTHAELIEEKSGRYAELYNVQAAAFSSL